MARKRISVNSWHPAYLMLFEIACEERITFTLETPEQAQNLRNDIYTCRQAIYDSPDHKDLAAQAQNVRFLVDGVTLIAEPIRSLK